jgi:hypothetical protein
MKRVWIFGYGSLINRASLRHTLADAAVGEIVPGRIAGWRRSWSNRVAAARRTGLSVRPEPGACVNGVAIELLRPEFEALDRREAGYLRQRIEAQTLVDGELWLYTKPDAAMATAEFPIAVSYLDVVLSGCLALGRDFAVEFLTGTPGLVALMNDREAPVYPRRTPLAPAEVARIDTLLREHLPGHVTLPLRSG